MKSEAGDRQRSGTGPSDSNTHRSTKAAQEYSEVKPPDGGWGWMVALGCFLITTLIAMVGPCFGILFSQYLLDLGTSSTMTAWIFNTQCFLWNVIGLITRPLTLEFGWRTIGVVGAFMTSVSIAISAFSPNAEFMFFSFSLLSGTGGGAVVCLCFTILPHYFDKRRGLANAMMMGGVCLGQILAPPMVQFLQVKYGFTGATLILSAIMLHACIGASFFHPVEWHSKKVKKQVCEDTMEESILLQPVSEAAEYSPSDDVKSLQSNKVSGKEIDWVEVVTHARRLRMDDDRRTSEVSHLSLSSSVAISTLDITSVGAGYIEDDGIGIPAKGKDREDRSIWKILVRVANTTMQDLKVLRSPRALIISLGATFCINGYINFIMMVPFAMQVAGFSLESSAWCISVSAICNLMMRLLVSSMSDWKRFNVKACYMSGFVIIFISNLVFPFLTDLRWMVIVMGLWGCGVGTNMGVYNLVMIAVMGLDNLAPVFGASCFMVALGFITFGPMIGMVRDATQSYYASMWVVAGMLFSSIVLWLFMPAAQAYDKKRNTDASGKKLEP